MVVFARSLLWLAPLLLSVTLQPSLAETSRMGECVPDSPDLQRYHCVSGTKAVHCEDEETECANWASRNECRKNPGFMLEHCRKSCATCLDGHSGTLQVAPTATLAATVARQLQLTVDYLRRRSHSESKSCQNTDPNCALRAAQGECESSQWMKVNCAPACQTCHVK